MIDKHHLVFAETCMLDLLSTTSCDGQVEISASDLTRIQTVLDKWKPTKE